MDQNDLISRIIATERQAQAITEYARTEHTNIEEHLAAELEALRLRYQREADAYLDSLRQKAEAESAQRLAVLERRLQEKLAQIESIHLAQKDAWVDAIFQRIIGKDGA